MESYQPILPIGNLNNIIESPTLKWIFVGGKGGVGKTSVSTSLAVLLSEKREKILIISTDPAHNLSDAFNQKMGSQPTLINGFNNLYGLEINPKEIKDDEEDPLSDVLGVPLDDETENLFEDLKNSIPGIDEALAIGLLLQVIDKMNYSLVIFDTAPTGHTLRMLSFPKVLEEAFGKLNNLKEKLGPMSGLLASTMGEGFKNLTEMISVFKVQIEKIRNDFTNNSHTTFIAVCIPEFLSMYETERLIQELNKGKIDCHNIVINQVLFINKENDNTGCDMCKARFNMQCKYIRQIQELYGEEEIDNEEGDDVNMNIINDENKNNNKYFISILPLQEEEIRGIDWLKKFGKFLIK
jgi:arsenite-transporting ATPase